MQHVAPVEEFPVEKWETIIALNLTAGPKQFTPIPTASGAACRAACDAIDAAPSPRSAAVFLLTAAALLSVFLLSGLSRGTQGTHS